MSEQKPDGRGASDLCDLLGPPPEPRVSFGPTSALIRLAPGDYYTTDQMRAYAAQERAAERERCAKLCESLVDLDDDSCDEAERCAAAIRGA